MPHYDLCLCLHAPCRAQSHGWPADPMWTESNWPSTTPKLLLLLEEGTGANNAVLAAGVVLSVVTLVAIAALKSAHANRLKAD